MKFPKVNFNSDGMHNARCIMCGSKLDVGCIGMACNECSFDRLTDVGYDCAPLCPNCNKHFKFFKDLGII